VISHFHDEAADMLGNMKTGTKILAAFGLAVAVAILVGAAGYVSADRIGQRLEEVASQKFPAAMALNVINEAQTAVARGINTLQLRRADSELRRSARAGIDAAWKRMDESWREFEKLPHGGEALRLWKAAQGPWSEWRRAAERAIDGVKEHERLVAQGVAADDPRLQALDANDWRNYQEARRPFAAAEAALVAVIDQTAKDVELGKKAGEEAVKISAVLILLSIALGGIVLLLVGVALGRSIDANIRTLLAEAGKLTAAVKAGELDVRGDVSAVNAEFRPVVEGVNHTIEAFVKPIEVTAEYVDRISKGDLPPKITDDYRGDFNAIKQNLNQCIDAVKGLVGDADALAQAAIAGRLTTRADASKHEGDFRKIVEGFNGTLDAVMKPIDEAAQVLERLAQRDLRARVEGSYRGDHAKIAEALNASAGALHDAMAQVAQAVNQVSAASTQIASSSQAVASGASEQASSLEETSSSLESMSSMTKQAADSAQQAAALASTAKSAAAEGTVAMEQMTGAMGKIKTSAEGTSQIIKDINEIAFQTNLLALNAAVEAARAGEAGRGFAVVAEEVRSLALRSKEAANKTEELIRQSVREAGEGEVTAKHVNEQLSEIAASVSKVTEIVAEMAAASREQASGIDQVNKAVGQMNTVTQQNAANSEESSSAAAELSGQSEELAAMVGTFQLESGMALAKRPATVALAAARGPHQPSAARRNGGSGQNGIPLRPEEVIPMEGDPQFKEF
jgi:methyl-accepting chemotaxis protein